MFAEKLQDIIIATLGPNVEVYEVQAVVDEILEAFEELVSEMIHD